MAVGSDYVGQILASPWFVSDEASIQAHFARIAELVAERVPADACLLYVKASEGGRSFEGQRPLRDSLLAM